MRDPNGQWVYYLTVCEVLVASHSLQFYRELVRNFKYGKFYISL